MELYIDSSDLDEIKRVTEYYPADGITTNPNILAKSKAPVKELLKSLRDISEEKNMKIFVQVTAESAQKMLNQAKALSAFFGERLVIKLPAVSEGYKAIELLKQSEIAVLSTVIHSATQVLVAAKAGADYVAPYVSHIDNIGADGIKSVSDMLTIIKNGAYPCKVLGASFRTVDQIKRLALIGCDAVTITPQFFDMLIKHPSTDESMQGFSDVWKKTFPDMEIDDFVK